MEIQSSKKDIARIAISFDDGRADNYPVFQTILEPLGIPATFNITSGYLDGSCPKDLYPAPAPTRPLTIEELQALAQSPLTEIAGHGDAHICEAEDAEVGRDKLCSWLKLAGEDSYLGYACPNSNLTLEELQNPEWATFAYIRTGHRLTTQVTWRVLCRKLSRIFHIPATYRIGYGDSLLTKEDQRILYSVSVLKSIRVEEVLALVQDAVEQKKGLILNFHSIGDTNWRTDNWTWNQARFRSLCEKLKCLERAGQLKLVTVKELQQSLINKETGDLDFGKKK